MKKKSIEVVAPAGDLESGLYAFKAGADAVYFGLPRFSARKSAVNLSFSDVRRLKGYALAQGGHIYAAVNTVITEEEMTPLLHWINELVLAEVDGMVVQDLGLAAQVKQRFPELPLHGSTQLGVHNKEGLAAAAEIGLKRVVLSRELSLNDIGSLEGESPQVEREVFVHGALCYGFSGLCLASALITGRSGNRGECAQICRTWFENGEKNGFYFSCVDLDAGDLIEELRSRGVRALKIEGRMKSSAYIFNTASYYRALMDGDMEKAEHYRNLSAISFARPQSKGFLAGAKRSILTNHSYPSHTGIPGAKIVSTDKKRVKIRALSDLNTRDRLMRIPTAPPDEGISFVLSDFWIDGNRKKHLKKGECAVIEGCTGLHPGMTLMKTFSHDMYLKSLKKESFAEYKKMLTLRVGAKDGCLKLGTETLGVEVERSYEISIEPSRGSRRFEEVLLSRFSGFEGYPFGFSSVESFDQQAPIPQDIFIPPSALKQIRNSFYRDVHECLMDSTNEAVDLSGIGNLSHSLPPRDAIRYPDGFPFIAEGAICPCAEWPLIDGWRYLALPPVMFASAETLGSLLEQIEQNPHERFAVGLSNVGHLSVARQWKRIDNVSFFLDYGIYAANTHTLLFAQKSVERLLGAYTWLEASDQQREALKESICNKVGNLPDGLRVIDRPDIFPLFISRACFKRADEAGECEKNCPRDFTYKLKQNKSRFDVRVVGCLTYLFLPQSDKESVPTRSKSFI